MDPTRLGIRDCFLLEVSQTIPLNLKLNGLSPFFFLATQAESALSGLFAGL